VDGILALVESNRVELDRSNDGVVVVLVIGEHDVYTAPSLRDQIQAVIEEKAPFIVDLTPATFVDSSILRVLLEARRQAEEHGLGFAIALGDGEGPGVRRILEVTGLMSVFPVLADREEALHTARTSKANS
jgi:anti-sigma B factor antagonist